MALPTHIGIIMDGNRRAGKASFSDRLAGHRAGADTASTIVRAAMARGIPYLTLFAFSTENWRRSETEVTLLMELFREFFDTHITALLKENIAVSCIGRRDRLPADIIERIVSLEAQAPKTPTMHVQVAIDYGGRDELVRAFHILSGKTVNEETISNALDTAGVPDPDLIIRTGGEHRLSGFLLWQVAYAEIYVTDVLWPHFTEAEFTQALEWYGERERRHGK